MHIKGSWGRKRETSHNRHTVRRKCTPSRRSGSNWRKGWLEWFIIQIRQVRNLKTLINWLKMGQRWQKLDKNWKYYYCDKLVHDLFREWVLWNFPSVWVNQIFGQYLREEEINILLNLELCFKKGLQPFSSQLYQFQQFKNVVTLSKSSVDLGGFARLFLWCGPFAENCFLIACNFFR